MPYAQNVLPSEARYNALKAKHFTLEREINVLQQCPSSDDILKALKREKLRIKQEMEGLSEAS
ncbi:MAG: DUF465 domain-containing protein [Rhodospirillales bacterium]|nr:DUF465 domain-containing protein [Rhodospirillales bacterium]MCB9980466.1 DUF465 domain-containing protein [Rhodospirillales bacterium]